MEEISHFFIIFKDAIVLIARWIDRHNGFVNAIASAIIASFTIALVLATRKLWKVAQNQSIDMRKSLAIAKEASDAAKKSAEVAENTMIHTQRAYVFVQRFDRKRELSNIGIIIYIVLENTGETPVKNMVCNFDYCEFADGIPNDFDFPEKIPRQYGVIGRKATFDIDMILPIDIFRKAFFKKTRVFIYGWIDYNDVFPNTPRHRTECCYEVIVNADTTFSFQIYGNHNGSDDECSRKPYPYIPPT